MTARTRALLTGGALASVAVVLLLLIGHALGRHPLALDHDLSAALRGAGSPGLRKAMVALTALGDGVVLTLFSLAVVGLLLVLGRWRSALLVAGATLSGSILAANLKLWIGRARPEVVDRLVEVNGLSFPSGHAANSAVVYLTIAGLVAQIEHGPALRRYTLTVAILLTAAVGISRVYLGVHWPTDVAAGWLFGTLWALAWRQFGTAVRG